MNQISLKQCKGGKIPPVRFAELYSVPLFDLTFWNIELFPVVIEASENPR